MMQNDHVTSEVNAGIADLLGAEAQRAAIEVAKLAEPKEVDAPTGSVVLSLDEREMLRNARNGVTWPKDTMEAITCAYLERHGLLRATRAEGDCSAWELTNAGAKLADEEEAAANDPKLKPDFLGAIPPPTLDRQDQPDPVKRTMVEQLS